MMADRAQNPEREGQDDPRPVFGYRRLLLPIAAGSFLLLVLGGMLVPIYYDETGWRFQERAWIDGGFDIGYSDICGPNTIARAPLFMMPVRAFSAFANLHLADPLFIRIEGVLCALAWTALFWILTAQACADAVLRRNVRALAFAVLGLGFLPCMLVLSRPEQPLILSATLAIVIALAHWPASPTLAAWGKAVAITILAAIALSYHLKGVPYALIFLACIIVSTRRRQDWVPKLFACLVVVGLTFIAARYWFDRFSCPNEPQTAGQISTQVGAAVLGGKFGVLLAKLPQMLAASSPLNYVRLVIPTAEPLSAWLPWGLFSGFHSLILGAVLLGAWGAALTLAVMRLVNHGFARRWQVLAEPRAVVALAILIVVLLWGASQLNRNDYEAAHILPMLMAFIVLSMGIPPRHLLSARLLSWLVLIIVPLSLVEEAIIAARLLPRLYAASQQRGLVSGQPLSLSINGYDQIRGHIEAAMVESGIPGKRRLNRLVVDDVTYLALQTSHLPIHDVGVLVIEPGKVQSVDPARYLISRGSDGVVVSCRNMPENFRMIASRSGPICALSGPSIGKLARSPAGVRQ